MVSPRITQVPLLIFAPQAIKRQLDRILNSAYFQSSKQLSCFLRFIVEESLYGRDQKLSQYAIAVTALGREQDFDPAADPIIRIEARRLRQTLAQYYQHEGRWDPIRIDIPTGRYAPCFRQNAVGVDQLPSGPSAVNAGLAANGAEGPTIALFNFVGLAEDSELRERAGSLTEELAAALSRFESIKLLRPVAAANLIADNSSSEQGYAADYVVDGTVQRWGEQIRLFFRLCQPGSGELIWSESIVLPASEKASCLSRNQVVQRLAAAIGDFHGVAITHWSHQGLQGDAELSDQHGAFIRFRHFLNRMDRDAFVRAVQACERSRQRWPDDALVNSLLADLCVQAYFHDFAVIDSPLEQAEAAACDAVALQPTSHLAHFALGKVYFAQREVGPCLTEFERCLQLNPHSVSIATCIGLYFCLLGNWEHGGQLVKNSTGRTADGIVSHFALALAHYRRGAYDFAWTEARRLHAPDLWWDSLLRATCLGQLGRRQKAQSELAELLRLCPDFRTRGRERMRRLLFLEENVESLVTGLRKAGLADIG